MERSSLGLGVRKGAWTEEEDLLLRKCIEKYGEGKWHQVPPRAGLNRCRKSCRLRWLNYLKPNIRRGEFQEDEVDLILRLHKLLGNRWSLIAGRLPGRTANDLKNYWNTHLLKKKGNNDPSRKDKIRCHHHHRKHKHLVVDKDKPAQNMVKVNVIKPRPRTFENFARIIRAGEAATTTTVSAAPPSNCPGYVLRSHGDNLRSQPPLMVQPQAASSSGLENIVDASWWETLLSSETATGEEGSGHGCASATTSNSNSSSNLKSNIDDWNNDLFDDVALGWWELLGVNNQLPI